LSASDAPYPHPLRLPDYRRLLLVSGAMQLAHQMQATAVGWDLYERTGSVLSLAWVGLAQLLPALVLFIPAGELADRRDRRRVMAFSMSLVVLGSLGLCVAALLGASPVWTYLCLMLTSGAQVVNRPSRDSLLPRVVSDAQLGQAVALNASVFQSASIFGPAAAGLIIAATHSAAPVFAIDFVLASIGLATVLTLTVSGKPPPQAPLTMRALLAGVEHVWRTKVILGAISLDLFAVLFGGATALLPVYAKDILQVGPAGLGWLNSAPAIGAVAMALWLTRNPPRQHVGRLFLGSVAGFGVATAVFGLSTHYALSFGALVVIGALDNVSVVVRQTIVQLWTPDGLRGRVSAVNRVFVSSSNELGAFESGALAALIGPVATVVAGGIATVGIVVAALRVFPDLRRLQSLHGPESEHARR
jgi:MFS family permease